MCVQVWTTGVWSTNVSVTISRPTVTVFVVMFKIVVKIAKFYLFAIFLYFILARIFWIGLKLSKSVKFHNDISVTQIEDMNIMNKSEHQQIATLKSDRLNTYKAEKRKKKRGWNKIIQPRRKDFGSLEKWNMKPGMKKVLLWTGYGPLQEGMMLWRRVLSDIGKSMPLSKIIYRIRQLFIR